KPDGIRFQRNSSPNTHRLKSEGRFATHNLQQQNVDKSSSMAEIACHPGIDSLKSLQILPKSLRIDLLPKTLSFVVNRLLLSGWNSQDLKAYLMGCKSLCNNNLN